MGTPIEYTLPASIPTVRVSGEYRGPDGRGLSGTITFTGPPLVTFPEADLFIAGPVNVKLDEFGRFSVRLPATDAPGMNPEGWSYTVKENLSGVVGSRTYSLLLPQSVAEVDLADVSPMDPLTPNYVAVPGPEGDDAYEVAVNEGFAGTRDEWLASLVGPQGPQGETGPQGPQGEAGPQGEPGVVQSVNGYSVADITLSAADVGAAPADHSHSAAEVGAVPTSDKGAANGVATLDDAGELTDSQIPDSVRPRGVTAESLGLKVWNGDPITCMNSEHYPGVGVARLVGVWVDSVTTVSEIVWHMFGYTGGLQSGSWAAIYDNSGIKVAETGDMSTAAYEPAEQHSVGGGASSSPLTAPVTLQPGHYRIVFVFRYDEATNNGPGLLRFHSTGVGPSFYGLTGLQMFGYYDGSVSTTPWNTIQTGTWKPDSVRYWIALA